MPPKVTGTGFADDETQLEWAERLEYVLRQRARGVPVSQIAKELGLNPRHIFTYLQQAAEDTRTRIQELCDQRFSEHDSRYEYIYRSLVVKLESVTDPKDFAAIARAAVTVLERQSRLLGLDRDKPSGGGNRSDWLDSATPSEILSIAKNYGIAVPEHVEAAFAT